MEIKIAIPQEIYDYCAENGITEESKVEDAVINFINDALFLHSKTKLLEKFKKWNLERDGRL